MASFVALKMYIANGFCTLIDKASLQQRSGGYQATHQLKHGNHVFSHGSENKTVEGLGSNFLRVRYWLEVVSLPGTFAINRDMLAET